MLNELWKLTKRLFQFRLAAPIVFLTFGILFEIFGYVLCGSELSWSDVWVNLGNLLLASVLFSFLTSCVEYIGVFRKNLSEIVYSTDYLVKRKDIEEIWERVSMIMFRSVFPNLHHRLFDTIKNTYFPQDGVAYYENARCVYDIQYADEGRENVVIRQEIEFEIIAIDENEFPFTIWNSARARNDGDFQIRVASCKIDGKDMTSSCVVTRLESDSGKQDNQITVKLKSRKRYNFQQVIEKRYNIKYDNTIGYKAKWLVNNMRVQVFHPEDLRIEFIDRGTTANFRELKRTENFLEYEFKGLILRRQGYLLILNKNENQCTDG